MSRNGNRVRVLYSFPHKLGASRICYTAWQQVNGLAAAGAEVLAFPGALSRPVDPSVTVRPTLARGKIRIPYKVLGTMRALALHDYIVARRLENLVGKIDIVHTWPLAALQTLKVAARLSIPAVLERPNAHTRYDYTVVQKECEKLGVAMPLNNEHVYKPHVLLKEEEEYRLAYRLLCPSDFVVRTFLDEGYAREKLARHIYGFDGETHRPCCQTHNGSQGLAALFVGACAMNKGVHYALEAWLNSPAHRDGTFRIAGEFIPAYAEKLAPMLTHPSVRVLGHRKDVPELMRESDILIFPSITEGFGLVIAEAMGSGCVPLASDACTDICKHMENAMVHRVGDVEALTRHITALNADRALLNRLRSGALETAKMCTWTAAGERLLQVYRDAIAAAGRDYRA